MSGRRQTPRFAWSMLLALHLLVTLTPATQAAPRYDMVTLIEQERALDGQEVTVSGEVVGDVMLRGDFGWINVGDGTAFLGIRGPASELKKIQHAGRYQIKGDVVEVTGIFHRVDSKAGGELDIEATSVTVLERGVVTPVPIDRSRVIWAIFFVVTTLTLGVLWWLLRYRPQQASQ